MSKTQRTMRKKGFKKGLSLTFKQGTRQDYAIFKKRT
jgi:hypothetical protein